jgi:hypothetical protein
MVTLYLVWSKNIVREPKYTRMVIVLLLLSLMHSGASISTYLSLFHIINGISFDWSDWTVGLLGNGTILMLLITQIQLLGVFSPIFGIPRVYLRSKW